MSLHLVFVWLSVCGLWGVGGVWGWGLILGKSGETAKARAILSLPLLALLLHSPFAGARLQWPRVSAKCGEVCSVSRGKSWLGTLHTQ